MDPDVLTTPTALLARVRDVHAIQMAAEAELVQLAAAWADAHPDLDPEIPADNDPASAEHDPLIPAVDWTAGAAFAAALGMSTQAGEALIRDALVLRHRLPRTWARVVACQVPVWRARRIAQRVHTQPRDVADLLDEQVAPIAERVGPVTLDRLLDEAMLRLHADVTGS